MKIKKCLPFVFFLLITSFGVSQNKTSLTVSESSEFKDDVKSNLILAMHSADNGVIGIVRQGKRSLLFDIFDKELNRTDHQEVEIEKKEKFSGFLNFGNKIKLFTVYSPSKTERIIYCYDYDINTAKQTKSELFKTTVEKNRGLFSGGNKRQTSFAISPNGNYFVVATDNIKKNLNSYTVWVFDTNTLELLYKKAYQEDKEKFYEPNDITINDDMQVFTLGKLYLKGKSQKKKGKANYDFVINKVTQSDTKVLNIKLAEEEHINSLVFDNDDNQITLLGFYSERHISGLKGGLVYEIDEENLSLEKDKSFQLPKSVYEDLFGDKRAERKKDKELYNFYVDYVLQDGLGNTYILAEQFYVTTVYVSTGQYGGYWQTVYHYDDILILKFNANSNLEWGRSIFKVSESPSYNAFIKDGELHVILNSGKNLVEKKDGRTKVSKGWFESSSLYDITFSENGEVQYNKIQDNKGNTYYMPYYGIYDYGRFITVSRGKKKKQFLILE